MPIADDGTPLPLSTVLVGSGTALPAAYADVELIAVINIALIINLLIFTFELAFILAIIDTAFLPKRGVLT